MPDPKIYSPYIYPIIHHTNNSSTSLLSPIAWPIYMRRTGKYIYLSFTLTLVHSLLSPHSLPSLSLSSGGGAARCWEGVACRRRGAREGAARRTGGGVVGGAHRRGGASSGRRRGAQEGAARCTGGGVVGGVHRRGGASFGHRRRAQEGAAQRTGGGVVGAAHGIFAGLD